MFFISSNLKGNSSISSNKRQNGSGYAVVYLGVMVNKDDESGKKWTDADIALVKRCKSNICTSKTAHFQSSGYYASFGNKADYKRVGASSVSQYTTKYCNKPNAIASLLEDAHEIEQMVALELDSAVKNFSRYIYVI